MPVKSALPPREFYAECPHCGTYRISEDAAREYLSPELRKKLSDRLAKGAAGAKLKFKNFCFTCKPNHAYIIELVTLTRESMH